MMSTSKNNFWLSTNGLAAIGLIAAVLYFLLAEHRAHFLYALPFLILLLCPVMHVFMHGGHGHGGHGHAQHSESHEHHREEEQ
jgi:hypothetical protein